MKENVEIIQREPKCVNVTIYFIYATLQSKDIEWIWTVAGKINWTCSVAINICSFAIRSHHFGEMNEGKWEFAKNCVRYRYLNFQLISVM